MIATEDLTGSRWTDGRESWVDGEGMRLRKPRYYDPSVGRFIRMDSYMGNNSDPASLHKYTYANGNPISGIDPSGNMSLLETAVVSGGISALTSLVVSGIKAIRGDRSVTIRSAIVDAGMAFALGALASPIGSAAGGLLTSAAGRVITGLFGNALTDAATAIFGRAAARTLGMHIQNAITGGASGAASASVTQFLKDLGDLYDGKLRWKDEAGRVWQAGIQGMVMGGIVGFVMPVDSSLPSGLLKPEPGQKEFVFIRTAFEGTGIGPASNVGAAVGAISVFTEGFIKKLITDAVKSKLFAP